MADRPSVRPVFTTVPGLLMVIALVVVFGLASRRLFEGVPLLGTELGDTLYAVMAYLAIRLAVLILRSGLPSSTAIAVSAVCAGAMCCAIELFQLTDLPAQLAARPNSGRLWALVLGRGFRWWDLVALAVGVVMIAIADRTVSC